MKYLDPKFDLTFKRVFAENKDLMMSVLNALLPLNDGQEVKELEYLPTELIPPNDERLTIVDVRCTDNNGRQFLVEMQMQWHRGFVKRVVSNVCKAYASQSTKEDPGHHKKQDVYSLNFINANFKPDTDEFLHHYTIVNEKHPTDKLNLLHFTFAELPKFNPDTIKEKRKAVLWLRFLTEIDESTIDAPSDMKDDPEIKKALDIVETRAYTHEQLRAFDRYTDEKIRYAMLMDGSFEDGFGKGYIEGKEEGMEEGAKQEKLKIAQSLLQLGIPISSIRNSTGLTEEEIKKNKSF